MSRAMIGVVAAIVVVVLTAATYIFTTSKLQKRIRDDIEVRVEKSQQILIQTAQLEALGLLKRAESVARDMRLVKALDSVDVVERYNASNPAFHEFLDSMPADEVKPDFVAMVNRQGELWSMIDVPRSDPENWKDKFPAVAAALDKKVAKDIWDFRNGVMKVGVAPIYDPATGDTKGALVIAYALNAKEAQAQSALLGMDVAYFFQERVRATSFRRGGAEEDVSRQKDIEGPLKAKAIASTAVEKGHLEKVVSLTIGGEDYIASAARLPFNFSDKTSGALVMMSLTHALEPIRSVKITILALGVFALLISMLVMVMTARWILNPAEEIELGVTEIINGNIDYTFKPAGADFDGLANALNVMLARLLGRPEPGEEEFDENGNVAIGGKVVLDEEAMASTAAMGGATVATDPETLALAQEAEADYYRRIFSEYTEARKAAGEKVDGVSFEGFAAKLRLNEASLKKKYNCRAVRFRVQTKDGQVMLKPVPIF